MYSDEAKGRVSRAAQWMTPGRWRDAAFCLLFTVAMVAMQYRSGAFTADLASDPDEPAHAVSSLMVHDYLVQAFPHNPIRFAQNFILHYPKVAIGHWPPLFYCAEALWMLVAGRSRVALLLLVALCGAALASSVYLEMKRRVSTAAAVVSVAVLIHSSIFRQMLCTVFPDLALALLVFWAAVYCGEWMRFPSHRNRNLFVAFSVAAVMVHGRGAVLLLLPFCLLPLRRGAVLWKWAVAGTVACAALPVAPSPAAGKPPLRSLDPAASKMVPIWTCLAYRVARHPSRGSRAAADSQ